VTRIEYARHLASPAFSALSESAVFPAADLPIFSTNSGSFYINREPGSQSVDLSRKIQQIPKKY
jgi:hypothetical protein